jgi:Zn finger protein HypA/HybF involved in hydrogenase expression
MPRHGEEKNFRLVISKSPKDAIAQETEGINTSSSLMPAGEKWCSQCKKWIEYKGIFQFIACPKCGSPWRW